ncbi:MAG: ABC transporter substrate-binding protein [Microthrixaceae bacterium]
MRLKRRGFKLLALFFGLSLVAAACGSDDKKSEGTDGSTDTTQAPEIPEGGDLVIGAEQEPDCVDWISSCAGSSWGSWMMARATMPRAFDVVSEDGTWTYTPSIVLDGEPEVETDPKQVITYTISEEAVWNDGEPITSTDFKYTWEQITTGEDIYDTTGYANIESIDDSDPKVAVVTYGTPFAGWRGLFSADYGIYPSHLLEGQDRNATMANGYDFSAGPWVIEAWNKGVEVVLVPNDSYWGDKPKLDSVTFRFVTDTAAEFQAYQGGEVEMIYPQPQLDVVGAIEEGVSGSSSFTADTGNLEALWLNNEKFPFDSVAVRQAFAYSIDRDAVVEALFGGLDIKEASQSLNPPIMAKYTDVEAFSDYVLDLDQVDELMTGDGWEKNGAGFWEKGGKQADIEFITTAGNARRELTQQVVQEQAKEAGFNITIANQEAGTFFGETLPNGDYQMGLYAQVLTTLDPSLCNLFCSANIPTAANKFTGQNWQRVNIPALDPLLEIVANSLDEEERATAGKEADAILADNVVSIPLDPLPNILLWSDNILGPVEDNPILGPFHNMHLWGLAG